MCPRIQKSIQFPMKNCRLKITSYRAFVDGKQIGEGYRTKFLAHQAALHFIRDNAIRSTLQKIQAKPSYAPLEESA